MDKFQTGKAWFGYDPVGKDAIYSAGNQMTGGSPTTWVSQIGFTMSNALKEADILAIWTQANLPIYKCDAQVGPCHEYLKCPRHPDFHLVMGVRMGFLADKLNRAAVELGYLPVSALEKEDS